MIVDFLFTLNTFESVLLLSLFFCCLYQLYKSYLGEDWIDLFKPINFFALLTLFYCVIGPLLSSANWDGSILYRAVDHRQYYQTGLLAALISFLTFKLGFDFKNNFLIKNFGINKKQNPALNKRNYLTLFKWGEKIFIFSIICQFVIFGIGFFNKVRFIGNFNLSVDAVASQGGFQNAFIITINFFIVSILLMFISLLNGVNEKSKFIFFLFISLSVFINYAFRYRIFMLIFPIVLVYFFYKKTKPKSIFLVSATLSAFLLFGFIQFTRDYGSGISFERLQTKISKRGGSAFDNILKASFFDSNVFNTSSGMIFKTPSEYDYVGIAPVINAITLPIPRKIWPGKPDGQYITKLYKLIYPGEKWEVGAASLGFAEYYISGGWLTLISLNFLLGYFYKRLWIWLLYNFYDPLAQVSYTLYLSFLFIIYSRGYLLQIIYLYITIFAPLILINYLWNKRSNS